MRPDDEFCVDAYYFKANNEHYCFVVDEVDTGEHCQITIYDCEIPESDIINLSIVRFNKDLQYDLYTIDVWGKYYFIKFLENHEKGYQLYHETKGVNDNQIDGMHAVLKAAYKLALDLGQITPY